MGLITLSEMRAAIRRAVEERGADFVYPDEWKMSERPSTHAQCQYRRGDGTPACIVGLAMSYLRPDVVLTEFVSAHDVLGGHATRNAIEFAANAQACQDDGATWGEALASAEDWVAETGAMLEDN
jgi:hypothetical protein